MSATLYQAEAQGSYPDAPSGLSEAAAELDSDFIWQRIEAYCAFRWSEREVVWIVEGDGSEWTAPLRPATITLAERWNGAEYVPADPPAGPLGGLVLPEGMFKITAEVGAGPVPANGAEAFRRLAEYFAASLTDVSPGASEYTVSISPINERFRRNPAHLAKALQNSGAADMLRKYRRA